MQHAPTVAEALDIISRYLFMHSRGMVLSVHRDSALVPGAVEVRFELQVPGQGVSRQTLDVCLGDVHHFIELLAGPYALEAVSLPHTPVAPLSVYTRFFGAPVHPAQRHGGLHVARATFERRLQTVNPSLQRIAVDYLAQHFGNPEQALTTRVRHLLHRTLGTAQSDKRAIAAMLNLHPRTLQRYLDAERTSFDALRDGVQRELAQRYLCETHIPMTQLAGMLGYAEQSVLTRACRRWFGKTPSQLRRNTAKPLDQRT
jgi:AraC-like DNA-binding protein